MFFKVVKHSKHIGSGVSKVIASESAVDNVEMDENKSKIVSRARLGLLKEKIDTPSFIQYTNWGSIPNLIKTNYSMIDTRLLQLVLADTYHLREVINEYDKHLEERKIEGNSLKSFLGFDESSITVLTMGIGGQDKVSGYPKDKKFDLKQKDTSYTITEEDFVETVKTFKPDIYITPTESILSNTSKKKRERAVKASREFVDEITTDITWSNMLITISIEESYKIVSDIIYSKIDEYSEKVAGYFFNVFSLAQQTRKSIFDQFYGHYPDDQKMRMLEGDGNLAYVLENLILNGIDVFESRYPHILTEQNKALDIQTSYPEDYKSEEITEEEFMELLSKTPKTIELKQKEFQNDSSILCENCKCHSWSTINRAYIYHLIDWDEMNAEILLTLHNCHIYAEFFKQIRYHIENDTIVNYAVWFLKTQWL